MKHLRLLTFVLLSIAIAPRSGSANPDRMTTGLLNGGVRNDLAVDFGPSRGAWIWFDDVEWVPLHALSPEQMVTGDLDGNGRAEVIVDFGPGYGIRIWVNNTTWMTLHSVSPERVVTGDLDGNGRDELIVDFGPAFGIWAWRNNTTWVPVHGASPEQMVTGDLDGNGRAELVVDFGPFGVWVWLNNTTWVPLHIVSPKEMVTGDVDGNGRAEIIVDFGPAFGVWIWFNNTTWVPLHGVSPEQIVTGDLDGNGRAEIIIDFGPAYGLWVWLNNHTWASLHAISPEQIVTGDLDGSGRAELIVDFGSPHGTWVWANNTSWRPIPIPTSPAPSLVRVSGRQLLVRKRQADGTLGAEAPYVMRGVFWSPASESTNTSPTDSNNAHVRRTEFGTWYRQDIALMAAMNVNTVRLPIDLGFDSILGPTGLAVLDELYRHGIMVVMTVDDAVNDSARLASAVRFYRHHPAILMWSLGSEWNINRYFGKFPTVEAAAAATETAAAQIREFDTNHPVATSYGDIDANLAAIVNAAVPSVDIWSLNVYRGNTFSNAGGSLFDQWKAISNKPMFIGEFGVDAFRVRCLSTPPTGWLDEAAQAEWTLSLWNDVARNLSAVAPSNAALGGSVFAWNDEWWKVAPPGSQQTGGWTSDGFPDWHGTEEYFGIVDITRRPRLVYSELAGGFAPGYVPPARTITFRAISRGANMCGDQAAFRRDGWTFYQRPGGGGGGRGFNVAVVHGPTGAQVEAVQNFDTWAADSGDAAKSNMVAYLAAVPSERLILISVADEAGLNPGPDHACALKTDLATTTLVNALEALGSTQIANYCWRGSWAMAAIKRQSGAVALAEDYQRTEEARVNVSFPVANAHEMPR